MKATNFDKKFDSGEDITKLLDLTKALRPELEVTRIIETNNMTQKKTAIKKIQKLSADLTPGNLNWKELRDQGRK